MLYRILGKYIAKYFYNFGEKANNLKKLFKPIKEKSNTFISIKLYSLYTAKPQTRLKDK